MAEAAKSFSLFGGLVSESQKGEVIPHTIYHRISPPAWVLIIR